MNKTARIEFVMTEEDAAKLKEYARKTKLTVSSLIRMRLKGYCPKEAPGMEFYVCMNRLGEAAESMKLDAERIRDPEIKAILRSTADEILKMYMEIMRHFLSPNENEKKII